MNCQEALSLLYDVIDKEASEINVKEVQKHLNCCNDCLKKYQIEESLQLLVKERLKTVSNIPRIDELRTRVLSRLEEMDIHQSKSGQKSFPFRLPAVVLASAAAVVVLFGAAFLGKGLYNHFVEYIPIERAHWAAAADRDGFKDEKTTETLLAGVTSDFGVSLANSVDGLSMIGGRTEEIKGIKVSHFKYGNGDKVVSAFVFPANSLELPGDLTETRVEIEGVCHLSHNCRGCWLVYYKEGNALVVTATTDHTFKLLEFKPVTATGAI